MEPRYCRSALTIKVVGRELRQGESGVVLMLATLILIAFLVTGAFALDLGNFFRSRIAMQNAADAAAIATVNYVATHGRLNLERTWGITSASASDAAPPHAQREALISARLQPMAEKLVRANMAMAGLPHQSERPIDLVSPTGFVLNSSTSENGPVYEYTVSVRRRVDLLLMHAMPLQRTHSWRELAVIASAQRGAINVSLLLDVSDSMNCPKDASLPCTCLSPQVDGITPSCPAPGARRFDDLMNATGEFLKLFELHRDGIHLVPFNISARAQPIRSQLGLQGLAEQFNFDPQTITAAQVDALVEQLAREYEPQSATNICDGLTQAWALADGLSPDQPRSYVLFTDGAPTAGRFLFTEAAANANLSTWDSGYLTEQPSAQRYFDNRLGEYDYMHHTIEWLDRTLAFRAGPSLLVESGHLVSSLRSNSFNPAAENPEAPRRPTPAGCQDGLHAAPMVSAQHSVASATEDAFACLDSLEAHLPRMPAKRYGGNYNKADGTLTDWREQYYNCAIALSDFIRDAKGTIYAVGLGANSNSPTADPTQDPYQDINDNWGRRDVFSTRLALDLSRRNPAHAEFNYEGYADYDSLSSSAESVRVGRYYPTHNSADIKLLFTTIGRGLLLKLVY